MFSRKNAVLFAIYKVCLTLGPGFWFSMRFSRYFLAVALQRETSLRGLRPGYTQTSLFHHKD